VKVGPGLASSSNTKASGEGTQKATSGKPALFTVTSFDRFGNAVKEGGALINGELVLGNTSTPIQVIDNGDGTYAVNYTVLKSGKYNLNVKVGDQLIKGAPLTVTVDPGEINIENTEITFLDRPLAGLSGVTIHMMDEQHNLRLAGGDKVVAECTPKSPVAVLATDNEDGTYHIAFPPNAKGKYRVNVKVNGHSAPKGPWELQVKENPLDEGSKQKIAKLLPKSSSILSRLLAKTTDKEREVIFAELSALRK